MQKVLSLVFAMSAAAGALATTMFGADSAADSMRLMPAEIGLGWKDGWVGEWRSEVPGLTVADTTTQVSNGLVKIVRRWTWQGKKPLEKVTLSVRCRMPGDPARLKPFMPGILFYGNPSNKGRKDGRVPVFAGERGEFAIFEEHRLSMPFVLVENSLSGDFAAIHTLPSSVRGAVRSDLWWSAGVETAEGGVDMVLLSGPIGYNRRRSVAKALQGAAMPYEDTYITMRPGQIVEKTFWLESGRATEDAFGFEQAMDVSLDLFKPYDATRHPSIAEIAHKKRNYAMTRWMENEDDCGFCMYELPMNRREVVLGWAGCSETCAYALPVLNLDRGDWDKAQRSLDCICRRFSGTIRPSDGMFRVCYDFATRKSRGGDSVSCGQSLLRMLKAVRFAEKSGGRLDPALWKDFADKASLAMSKAILRSNWKEPRSTNAGFLIAPLVMANEQFGRPECIAAARKLAGVFERRYFGYDHVYWGGTLDARCEDKEGAFAAFQGYAALLRHAMAGKDAEAERKYARLARHAMNMMLSYTMVWDVTYPPGRLSDHAFKSTGWTVVSAQNQHLDAFGVVTAPEVWWMGDYLRDDRLKKLSEVMYRSCYQLTSASGTLGEQILHTNFKQRGDMSDVYAFRGDYCDTWTVFWLTAHFLEAAADFREMGVKW